MTIPEYLSHYSATMPEWLKNFSADTPVSFTEIMKGRIGYYPGCGDDGQLIKLCSKSHTVHTFFYVDYLRERKDVIGTIKKSGALRGYHHIGLIEFGQKDLLPSGKYPSVTTRKPFDGELIFQKYPFYCIMGVWERDNEHTDEWGVERLAVVFLRADAIDFYYQLFVAQYRKAPWILLLQDHGLGCNYDKFGKGGLLDEIIEKSSIKPQFVLCGFGTAIWDGYKKLNCEPSIGGMHCQVRKLYESTCQTDVSKSPLKEVWLLTCNPNGDIVEDRFFAELGEKEISEISKAIADTCGKFTDVIKEYIERLIRIELAKGETEIHISSEDGSLSEFIVVKVEIDSSVDWSGSFYVDEPAEEDKADVFRGDKIYVTYGYYGGIDGIYSSPWHEESCELIVE